VLRAHAKGLYGAEAAVGLLIGHANWLARDDFVDRFVELGRGLVGGTVLALVDWQAAVRALDTGRLGCSGSEARVLRLAASIAEGVPVDLGAAVTGLDQANIGLVVEAVLHAGGHRQGVVGRTGMQTP
jgi:hypothetical protein